MLNACCRGLYESARMPIKIFQENNIKTLRRTGNGFLHVAKNRSLLNRRRYCSRNNKIFNRFSVEKNKYGHKFVLVDKHLDLKSIRSQKYFYKTPPYGSNNNKLYVYNRAGEELGSWPRFYFRKIIGYFGEYCMVHNRGNSSLEAYYLDEKGRSRIKKIELPFDILDPLQVSLNTHGKLYVSGEGRMRVFNSSLQKVYMCHFEDDSRGHCIVGKRNRGCLFGEDDTLLFRLRSSEGEYWLDYERVRYHGEYLSFSIDGKDEIYSFNDSCYLLYNSYYDYYLYKLDYNHNRVKKYQIDRISEDSCTKIIPEDGLLIRSSVSGIVINRLSGGDLLKVLDDKLLSLDFKVDRDSGCIYYVNANQELIARDLEWERSTVVARNVNARIVDTEDSGIVCLKPIN